MDLLQSSLYEIMEEFSNYQVALQPPKDDEEDEQDGEENRISPAALASTARGANASTKG